jgi:hypothetical protein
MDHSTTVRKRWRPTFSLRLVMLLTTAICLYFAGWQLTVTRGVKSLAHYLAGERNRIGNSTPIEAKAPFVLAAQLSIVTNRPTGLRVVTTKSHYLWAFGHFIKLPFTTEQVVNPRMQPPRLQLPWQTLKPPFSPPNVVPPWQLPSPPPPMDTPPHQRVMPYRIETAAAGAIAVYT